MEVEKNKENPKGDNSGDRHPRKEIRTSISNRIKEMEERISGAEDSIGNMDTAIKENTKCKKILSQNIQEIQDTMRRSV
jgi:chromosome segregation ATPase